MAAKKSNPKTAASKAAKPVSANSAPKAAAKPEKKAAPVKKEASPAAKPEVKAAAGVPSAANGHANGSVSHSASFVEKQKQRLLDLRDELVDAMTGTTRDTIRNAPEGSEASGSGMHQGDAGSDAYDRDFALSVLAKEQDALYEIEQALQRIKKGAYGVCEMSGKKIPQLRLEAIPFARLTVECQAQWEKEYGNRRFRPSNEVGFSGGNYADDEDSESVSLDEDDD
jgi:DnaK suppressor protein